jgi:hypothetical protein
MDVEIMTAFSYLTLAITTSLVIGKIISVVKNLKK